MQKFSQLYSILSNLKNKQISQSQFKTIKYAARKQARDSIHLWKFKPEIRILFKMAKYQSYLMLFLGLTVLPFTLYQKYQQDKQKLTKIVIFTPFALGACLGPLLLYKRFSKRLIQAISYNLEQNKLVLTRFRDGKQIYTSLNNIVYTKSDKGRVKQLIWTKNIPNSPESKFVETRKFQIQALGQWESIELFKYLIQTQNKKEL